MSTNCLICLLYYNTTTHKLPSYRSFYGFNLYTIHFDNHYVLSSPATEEWLDLITTVHNHIYDILKCINYKLGILHVEKARNFNTDN